MPNTVLALFDKHIGRCMRCMRKSFVAVLISATLLAANAALSNPVSEILSIPLMAALGATAALWGMHVLAYAWRHAAAPGGCVDHKPGRRAFMARLLMLSGLAAAASISPALAQNYGRCPGMRDCGPTQCQNDITCCPNHAAYLSFCDCKCYRSWADLNASGCMMHGLCL